MQHHRTPLTALTDWAISQSGRLIVLVLWLIAAGTLSATAPKLADVYNNKAAGTIGQPESVKAGDLLAKAFPNQNGIPAIIVLYRPSGLTSADEAISKHISCWLVPNDQRAGYQCPTIDDSNRPAGIGPVLSTTTVPQAASQVVSTDKTTETIIASLNISQDDATSINSAIDKIRAYTADVTKQSNGLQINVTGPAGILDDLVKIFASTDIRLLLTTVALVLVLLLIIYRSPLLALLPLVGVGWVLQVVNPILGFAGRANLFPISQQVTSIMSVLLFGAGTDYVIFIVSRYREELHDVQDHRLALRTTMASVGEAITSSAGTVILGLLTLVLAVLGLYSSLGWVLAIAVAVMLLAGLTLVPAILSLIGRAIFWPFVPKVFTPAERVAHEAQADKGFWHRIAAIVSARPLISVIGSLIVLGILALGYVGVPDVYNQLTDLKKPTQSTDGYKTLANHFEPGTLAPFSVVVHFKDNTDAYTQFTALDRITAAVAGEKSVAQVTGPTRPDGKAPTVAASDLQTLIAQLPQAAKDAIRSGNFAAAGGSAGGPPDPQVLQAIGAYAATLSSISADTRTATLQVTLKIDPYSKDALDAMQPIRDTALQAARAAGLDSAKASVQLTGVTPQLADVRAASDRDKTIIVPLVLVLVAIVLGLLLRSVVAPIYLLFAVTLNYFAALGATSFIVTHFLGDEGLSYATPLYTFIFLVALGADYTIFLMSRVREEAGRRNLHDGTQIALGRTGGVITSAGLILAGTFLVLATLPLRILYHFGLAVAIGVLLDTFVVRGFLVPGIVLLLGKWNWWPGRLPATTGDSHMSEEQASPRPELAGSQA